VTSASRRLEVTLRGRVQGVGFRMFVVDRARQLGLRGWVANEAGGTVRTVAEGPEDHLSSLLTALRDGPRGARVEGVTETWSDSTGEFGSFTIRSGFHGGD